MSDIRWDNLRNLAGFTLDQLEARPPHNNHNPKDTK